jgi:hypothetical protein
MYELKTKETENSVIEFIEGVDNLKKREDAYEREALLQKLGKHSSGKACVYINKVADVDVEVIKELINRSVEFLRETYPKP